MPTIVKSWRRQEANSHFLCQLINAWSTLRWHAKICRLLTISSYTDKWSTFFFKMKAVVISIIFSNLKEFNVQMEKRHNYKTFPFQLLSYLSFQQPALSLGTHAGVKRFSCSWDGKEASGSAIAIAENWKRGSISLPCPHTTQ